MAPIKIKYLSRKTIYKQNRLKNNDQCVDCKQTDIIKHRIMECSKFKLDNEQNNSERKEPMTNIFTHTEKMQKLKKR